jgi:hypothetical protein
VENHGGIVANGPGTSPEMGASIEKAAIAGYIEPMDRQS